MYRKLTCIFIILTSQLLIILLGGTYLLANQVEKSILPGVRVQGIPLGDLTKDEAISELRQRLEAPDNSKIQITAGEQKWNIDYQKIDFNINYQRVVDKAYTVGRNGGSLQRGLQALRLQYLPVDIPVNVTFHSKKLRDRITTINEGFKQTPQNARLLLQDEKITVIKHREGRRIDVGATMERIKKEHLGLLGPVPAVVETTVPAVKTADLSSINQVLGECETKFNPNSTNRVTNLTLAAQKITHTLVKPGEIFSFNEQVGQRDESSGYKTAQIINNRTVLPGLGGGICQVSTTLYNAVLLANLNIVERYPHSMVVGYVTPGLDATVVYGRKDFKFKNNYDTPVYILSSLEDNRLSVAVLGEPNKENTSIRIVSKVDRIEPNVVVKKTSDLENGLREIKHAGSPGYKADVFRILVEDGSEVDKEHISSDYYPPQQRIILEGLAGGEGEKA